MDLTPTDRGLTNMYHELLCSGFLHWYLEKTLDKVLYSA